MFREYVPTQADIALIKQRLKISLVKVELLNRNWQVVDVISGELVGMSGTNDSTSDIRRTCTLTFHLDSDVFFLDSDSNIRFWMDKFVRIKTGIVDAYSKQEIWYDIGVYAYDEYGFSYDDSTNNLTINCVDYMAFFTENKSGFLKGIKTVIPQGSNIRNVLISTISQLGGVTKYLIEEDENENFRTIPYDLEFKYGSTIYDVIAKIRDLYPRWEAFFDIYGIFVFHKISISTEDQVVLGNDIIEDIYISEDTSGTLNGVRNYITVYGMDDIFHTVKLVDVSPVVPDANTTYIVNPSSPYTIEKIGEHFESKNGGDFEKITTEDLCRQRAEYEIWLSTNVNVTTKLSCVYIPWLTANQKIEFKSKYDKEVSQYVIKSIDFNEDYVMTLNLVKFYDLYPF